MIDLTAHPEGTVVAVVAQPSAKRNAILGARAGAVRIAVTAAPDKGKANAAIQAVLAEAIGCRASQVSLLAGQTSRQKRFLVSGLNPDEIRQRLLSVFPTADHS